MKKRIRKITGILAVMALMPSMMMAQSIKTDFDEKVIMTDSLNLPRNTSVSVVLNMLPELLQRPGDFLLSNYDIQVEGMSVGNARDVALSQLEIVDVEKIKVSESPIASYNNNGQGGAIDIILRSSSDDGKPYWGTAGVAMEYPLDVVPQANIGFKKNKFMVRGMLLAEVYSSNTKRTTSSFENDVFSSSSVTAEDEKFQSHLARAYMQYSPTDKDVLKLNVSEVYSNSKQVSVNDHKTNEQREEKKRSTMLRSLFNYKHSFARSSFTVEAQYLYSPGFSKEFVQSIRDYNDEYKSHNISGMLEYNAKLLPASVSNRSLELTIGSNFNGMIRPDDYTVNRDYLGGAYRKSYNTWYAMPYAILQGQFGKFRVKAVGEYQYFKYDMKIGDDRFTKAHKDFTGKLMTEWHFTPQKNLRLIFKRNIQRTSGELLFPNLYFDPSSETYTKGNADLQPMMSHEVVLDYIAHYKWKKEHSFTFNMGVSYNNVGNIVDVNMVQSSSGEGGLLGSTLTYNTFDNIGTNHILSGNLMALYSYKSFSISLTGNVFHNDKTSDHSKSPHYTYYNFSVYPHFNMKNGWSGGAKLTYYSKVDEGYMVQSDCAITRMTVGRSLKKFYVYVFQEVALQKYAEDKIIYSDNSYRIREYEMTPNVVGIGMKYRF